MKIRGCGMEIINDRYSITELSKRLKVTDHALRFYEKEFNLCVPRDDRGRRYYTAELANTLYQIKVMRDEGLEIKAIKNIISQETNSIEPPPVVLDAECPDTSLMLQEARDSRDNMKEIMEFFIDFRDQITNSMAVEVTSAREHLSREINKTKLELGACVENSARKLEAKMEKHFMDVDRSITDWREKTKGGPIKRLMNKIIK